MVSVILNLLDLLHGELKTSILMALKFLWESDGAARATKHGRSTEPSIVIGSTEKVSHAWRSVEEIEEGLLCDVIQVHFVIYYYN